MAMAPLYCSMAEGQHSDELRNVAEGDSVTLVTDSSGIGGGERISARCVSRSTQRASPESGEIRQSQIWEFDTPVGKLAASILDGLKGSADDPDFPVHNQVFNLDTEESLGYISDIIVSEE